MVVALEASVRLSASKVTCQDEGQKKPDYLLDYFYYMLDYLGQVQFMPGDAYLQIYFIT